MEAASLPNRDCLGDSVAPLPGEVRPLEAEVELRGPSGVPPQSTVNSPWVGVDGTGAGAVAGGSVLGAMASGASELEVYTELPLACHGV